MSAGPGPAVKEIKSLTGLRAIAAALVLFFHFRTFNDAKPFVYGPFDPLLKTGYLGVDIFFVLSGFIMCYVYGESFLKQVSTAKYRRFIQFRIARIYPIHVVTFFLMVAAFWIGQFFFSYTPKQQDGFTWVAFLHNAFMTHAWFKGVGAPNMPAWSISAEWFAYLVFPFLMFLFRQRTIAFAFLLAPVCLVIAEFFAHTHDLMRIMPEFLFGVCLCILNRKFNLGAKLGSIGGVAMFILATIPLYIFPSPHWGIQTMFYGFLVVSLTNSSDWAGRFLGSRAMVYLGEISYSVYMCHWFIYSGLRRALPKLFPGFEEPRLWMIIGSFMLTVAFSAVLFHAIEVPGRRLLRGRTSN